MYRVSMYVLYLLFMLLSMLNMGGGEGEELDKDGGFDSINRTDICQWIFINKTRNVSIKTQCKCGVLSSGSFFHNRITLHNALLKSTHEYIYKKIC